MYKALEAKNTFFRRGQLVLVAAGPGVGKSAFTLNLALKTNVPCFYFSADSDAFTQLTRSVSIETGMTLEESTNIVLDGDSRPLQGLSDRIWFDYNASPTLDDIEDELESYYAVYEEYPELVVIDNITNVRFGEDADPFAGLEAGMDYLHVLARQTNACVIGLHHVTGSYNDADKPVPLSGLKQQIGRVPEMVLTLFKPDEDTLCVSTVKDRSGKADPSGATYAELSFEGARMAITDPVLSIF